MRLTISSLAFLVSSAALAQGPFQGVRHDAYIGAGVEAKTVCSGVFVSGRNVNDVINGDVLTTDPRLGRIQVFVDRRNRCITTQVLPLRPIIRRACFVEGLGCTLDAAQRFPSPDVDVVPRPDELGPLLPDAGVLGVSVARLAEAVTYAKRRDLNTRGLVVVYRGKVIAEHYAREFGPEVPQLGWSMAKSVTHALVGVAVSDGLVGLDEANLVPEVWGPRDARAAITMRQLLAMTSGLSFPERYDDTYSSVVQMLFVAQDMGKYAAQHALSFRPGTRWAYSSGSINIAARVLMNRLGASPTHAFAKARLFAPLGMKGATFEIDGSGTPVGSSYVYATPRDWARFGQLYLNDGVASGERVLPEGWAKLGGTANGLSPKGEYGSGFWTNGPAGVAPAQRPWPSLPADAYAANGHDGQYVLIVPSKDLVVVRLGLTRPETRFSIDELGRLVVASLPE